MPLTRIRQTAIGDDSITSAKLAHDLDLDGQFVRVPHGTTAERPSSPVAGYMRFNTTLGTLEQWNTNTNSWAAIDSPPIISSLSYSGSNTATDPAGGETITLTGTNFKTGANVTVGGTTASSVSVVSSTSITFTTPAKTAADYDIVVVNANGLQATLTNGISYNGTPSFTTAAGNVGSVQEDVAMSTITIVAAEPDGGTLAYSITSGALPTGVSLGSANGQITGTPNVNPVANTTYNFTVTATDDENQTNSRAFNLIVLRPIYATQLANSLKFEDGDSAYLSRTPSSNGNRKTWTWSAWIKRANIGALTQVLLEATDSGGSSVRATNRFASDTLNGSDSSTGLSYTTNRVFRDSLAWYHILIAMDTTQATDSNRFKLYINGVQETSFSSITWPTLNADSLYNSTSYFNYLGATQGAFSQYFDGYMSDVHFIDGQALTPTSFAETFNGVWAPKAYSGSYGTNGFKLTFANSSDLGNDVSGNNNDYTPNNFTVSDHVIDSPTNNFATLNPLTMGSYNTLNEGNLRLASVYAADLSGVCATQFFSSGKWYWEVRVNGIGTYPYVGITTPKRILVNAQGTYYTVAWYANGGRQTNSSDLGTITGVDVGSFANGDIIMLALDVDARKLWWGENGTWANSGNPAAGTGEVASWTVDEDVSPVIMGYNSQGVGTIMNFGQDSTFAGNETVASNADSNGIGEFQYSPPTNFLAMTSKNLSESTINTSLDDRPEDYFNTVTYTGNGTSSSVTVGFQPDFTWIKARGATYDHQILDTVRGYGTKLLYTNLTNGEDTSNPARVTQNSNGFTTIDSPQVNANGQTYVAWNWKAGGTPTATNSAGAGNVPTTGSVMVNGVASTAALAGSNPAKHMSVNTKSGFSLVHFTLVSGGQSIAHGLGKTPAMIILKGRDEVTQWWIWHTGLSNPAQSFIQFGAGAAGANTSAWNNTAPTSTVFHQIPYILSVGSNGIAYCFAEIEGFSKFGTYTANQSTDGQYVHTGFKPAFVLVKSTNRTQEWIIVDNKRDTYNPHGTSLSPNTTGGDGSGNNIDFTANGFKVKATGGGVNYLSGDTMIYAAFAEDPFKYSEAG